MSKIFAIAAAAILALTIGLSSTPSSARVGQKCGGFVGLTCGPHEFCQLKTGVCFTPDMQGKCATRPDACSKRVHRPVCGCNGQTFGNDCERMMAGQSKRHNGAC